MPAFAGSWALRVTVKVPLGHSIEHLEGIANNSRLAALVPAGSWAVTHMMEARFTDRGMEFLPRDKVLIEF